MCVFVQKLTETPASSFLCPLAAASLLLTRRLPPLVLNTQTLEMFGASPWKPCKSQKLGWYLFLKQELTVTYSAGPEPSLMTPGGPPGGWPQCSS